MAEPFDCPHCGGPIALGEDAPSTVPCPHCGMTIVVPEALRKREAPVPVVIRIDGRRAGPPASPRVGLAVGIAIAAAVLLGLGGAAFGLLGGIGAAVAPNLPAIQPPGGPRQLMSFGGEGIGPGLFHDARHLGIDGQGRLYVGEYQGGRIQVFDGQGQFLTQWFADREMPLTGMAVRRDGSVYTVQRGELLLRQGMTGESQGGVAYDRGQQFEDVALQADGGLLASWILFQDAVVVFDSDGAWSLTVPEAVSGQTGEAELELRVAADGRGDLLALGSFNTAVFRYDSTGRFVNRFGSEGDEPGQLRAPLSIAVDGQGNVYVGDIWGIEVFDRDGRFLRRLEVDGSPYGLAFDDQDHLWVVNGTHVTEYEVEAD